MLQFARFPRSTGEAPGPLTSASARLGMEQLEERAVPAVIDLGASGAVGSVDGVYFAQHDAQLSQGRPSQTFLRLDGPLLMARPTQGYNTDARPLEFDENATATRSLKLADVPAVTVGGVVYREFVLDVSQLTLLTPRVSLDQLRIYVGETGDARGYSPATGTLGGMSPVFDLDAGSNSRVVLDARLNSQSGGDMRMYVPNDRLAGGEYVYFHSVFGESTAPMAGMQAWSVFMDGDPPPPPPPPPPPAGTATIGGVVYEDLNGNFQQEDHEANLPDRTVFLDLDGNGVLDPEEPRAVTGEGGYYEFQELLGGTNYIVRLVTTPEEFAPSFDVTPAEGEFCPVDIGVNGQSQT